MVPAGRSGPMDPAPPAASTPQEAEECGLELRPMGLKVHYTFDKDSQVHCLARWPHILQVRTIPLDENNTIGVVDLGTCLMAITQCSPELVSQHDTDYTVYAFDYSEPDVPLVGQGMLSWGIDSNGDHHSQQLVTGRVTRNLLAIFGNGIRETLEVKLKLNAVHMLQRAEGPNPSLGSFAGIRSAPVPVEASSMEWTSFVQANPALGRSGGVTAISSPSMAPQGSEMAAWDNVLPGMRSGGFSHQPNRPTGTAPVASKTPLEESSSLQQPMDASVGKSTRPSRPSSRASRKAPTGRPRGRPRKRPVEAGNTSAAEEATDADDAPHKKRAKVTQVGYTSATPFGSAPDSLRVAASTAGSLRNMRPIAATANASSDRHLQDMPRAPTPVPDPSMLRKQQRSKAPAASSRRGSTAEFESAGLFQSHSNQQTLHASTSQDARSPSESIAQSPDQGYTPESAADLGSSPPVPRPSAFMRSSPVPSSPVLPTMPMAAVDSGFMSGGIEDLMDEEELPQELPKRYSQPDSSLKLPTSRTAPRPASRGDWQPQSQSRPQVFPFHEVTPGPPELLPTTSIFNPAGRAKSLNRASAPRKPTARALKRSNTTSCQLRSEPEAVRHERPATQPTPLAAPAPSKPTRDLPAVQPVEAARSPDALVKVDTDVVDDALTDTPRPTTESAGEESGAAASPKEPSPGVQAPTIASEPTGAGPAAKDTQPRPSRPPSSSVCRDVTALPPVPASDPVSEMPTLTLPQLLRMPYSEAPCPPSDAAEPQKQNKNLVKKQSIKERLEEAIQRGEMPSFCNNCGAIETPTWRKIWTQDHSGVPGFHEFSDKPGYVTTIDVLERDSQGQPTMHRLVKKNLGPGDIRGDWNELLLCNPCGIWLTKFKSHRPPDRWDKDAARLNNARKKKSGSCRSRKSRSKSDAQMNPTSEAYFMTDPAGPVDQPSPSEEAGRECQAAAPAEGLRGRSQPSLPASVDTTGLCRSPNERGPGSTHSRGSGTADSPIAVEDDLGTTRRLLFPSPRKEGVPKVLGELPANLIHARPGFHDGRQVAGGKEQERTAASLQATPLPQEGGDWDHQLFGTPPQRPSTPPPKATNNGPFKTPTRPTPSHRPITRSLSRSIRSVKSIPKSPSQTLMHLQRTPTRTPRTRGSSNAPAHSSGKLRTPRHVDPHAHFSIDDGAAHAHFESPFTATLTQLLSEANGFTSGSPSHGLVDLDLDSLPNLEGEDAQHLASAVGLDFGHFLSTDMAVPSSPPMMRRGRALEFGDAPDGRGSGAAA